MQTRGIEQRNLHRSDGHWFGRLNLDPDAQGVMIGKNAEVSDLVLMRWWHESDESCEEAMRLEVDVRSACACGALEGQADAAIRELAHGIVGKRWPQQLPEHSLGPFAITAVDDGGGVQRHAEGGDLERPRWPGRDSDARRSRERELHAPGWASCSGASGSSLSSWATRARVVPR